MHRSTEVDATVTDEPDTTDKPPYLLAARHLAKRFGPTRALVDADLLVKEREIHALVGGSGAGKSTLFEALSGLAPYDQGSVVFRGFPIKLLSRRDAIRVGIACVGQEMELVPDLSIYDNIVLPMLGRGRPEPRDLRERVAALLIAFGPADPLPLDRRASRLSVSQARLIGIARALVTRAKLYLFDEPFASLGARDIDGLIGVMMRLRLSGCGLVIATRRLEDVLPFADQVTVLEEGRTIASLSPHAPDAEPHLRGALRLDAGSIAGPRLSSVPVTIAPRLTVERLGVPPLLAEASFVARPGEIVALHGLEGAGCAALLEAVAGLRGRSRGRVGLDGLALPPHRARIAVRRGLAFVGPDQALPLPAGSGRDNLGLHADPDALSDAAGWPLDALCRSLGLPDDVLDTRVATQPSGVRQRLAIAGALLAGTAVVLLDDPTRGLARHEREAVHQTLRAAAERGRTVVLSCPDRDEALAVAHRCIVIREGRSIADLPLAGLEGEALTLLAAPSAAMARNTALLAALTRENGGAAFWALLGEDRVVCLNAASADAAAETGLRSCCSARTAETRIATALMQRDAAFVTEPDGSRSTLLVPISTRRGRPLGWIGLTLGPHERLPPAAAVAFRVETLAAAL